MPALHVQEAIANRKRFLTVMLAWSRDSRAAHGKMPPLRCMQRNNGVKAWHSKWVGRGGSAGTKASSMKCYSVHCGLHTA